MRYTYFYFTLLFSLNFLKLIAQPAAPVFNEAKPLLAYPLNYENLKDTLGNTIPGYDNIGECRALVKDSFIITFGRTLYQFNVDGFVIVKHNIYTGKLIWKDIYNLYNGSDGYFSITYVPHLDPDGNIEILGRRKLNKNYDYPFSFRRVYDFDTGVVLRFDHNPNNKAAIYERGDGTFVPVIKDSLYLNIYATSFGWPDTSRYGVVASLYNGRFDSLIVPVLFEQEIVPDFPVNDFSLKAFFFLNINDSITVGYITMRENKMYEYKTSSKLIFINHKDINNIHIFKVKNLEEVVPFNLLYPRNIQIDVRDGGIVLMDYDIVFPGPVAKPWVWRMDALGNDIDFWYNIQIPDSEYTNSYFLKGTDSLSYFKCWPSIKTKQGWDIITIDKNNTAKYLASITLKTEYANANYNVSVRNAHYIANDSILIFNGSFGFGTTRENSAFWAMTLNLNDLIRGSSTATQEVVRQADINIYPNPSNDNVFIECDGPILWQLLDMNGTQLVIGDDKNVDLSPYSSGMYILGIQLQKQIVYMRVIKSD